jgi:hypothetical protein
MEVDDQISGGRLLDADAPPLLLLLLLSPFFDA